MATNFFFLLFCLLSIGVLQAQNSRILTLEEALETAEDNSPNILQSQLNLERSQQLLSAEKAALKSNFSLDITPFYYDNNRQFNDNFSVWNTTETVQSSGSFRVSQPILPTDGTVTLINRFMWQDFFSEIQGFNNTTFSNNIYLNLEQPIFTYNRRKLQLRELELDLENTRLNFSMQQLSLERDVTQAFYNVHLQQLRVQISEDELSNQEKSYDIVKNKVEAGLTAKEELYQAELNLATSRSDLQNQQVSLENIRDDFKQLLGIPIFDEVGVLADIVFNPVEVDINQAIQFGLEQRMELRQRAIDIELSQFELVRTSALNEFKGNISVTLGLLGDDEQLTDIYQSPNNNEQISVSFQIPIWDWGEKRNRLRATKANIESQKINEEIERNNIIINVRRVYRNLQNLVTQIEIAEQNVRNAELTYDINLERYRNGDLTSMDLNMFQNQLSEKKIALSQALVDYKIEVLNLKIQTLYDFETGKSVVPELLK